MAQMTVAYEAPTTYAGIIREEVKVEAARRGLTQTQVGRLIGLSQPAVADRYRARTDWALNEIELLEEAMGLARGALLARCAIRDSNPEPADLCFAQVTGLRAVRANRANWELAA
jgi:hypothetical protein